jgi:hypothetical protein
VRTELKTYKIRAGDKTYPLAGLTQNVKEAITDDVIAAKHRDNNRRLKKDLVTAVEHAAVAERLDGLTFISTAVGRYIQTDAGQRSLIAAMMTEAAEEPVRPADIDAVMAELDDAESEASAVFRRVFVDAYPKLAAAMTPPSSPQTPTAGGAGSPGSPSTSTPPSTAD